MRSPYNLYCFLGFILLSCDLLWVFEMLVTQTMMPQSAQGTCDGRLSQFFDFKLVIDKFVSLTYYYEVNINCTMLCQWNNDTIGVQVSSL